MRRVASLLLMALSAGAAWSAGEVQTPAEAFNAGKDFANTGKGAVGGMISDSTGSQNLPFYNSSAPESAHFQGGQNPIGNIGTDKQLTCQNSQAPNALQQQECDAINFVTRNPSTRPTYTIDRANDPLLTGSQNVISNPGSIPGTSTQQCRVERTRIPPTYITESCSETKTLGTVTCARRLLMACDPVRDGCDMGGIVPNSWQGDMTTTFTPDGAGNFILQFGTIADNYWSGYGEIFDRNLTFEIRDLNLITKFTLSRAAYDDWLLVKINGQTVYVGPKGGDRLEKVSRGRVWQIQYCATCYGNPELNTSWNFGLDVDLRPYLVNGMNTLFMRTVVAGRGEGAIQITTRQQCPRNCRDQWDNSECSTLEARSK